MDLSAFSEANFDPKRWINDVFKTAEASENEDVFALSLVEKLELHLQQLNVSFEDNSQKILDALPGIIRDTESLTDSVKFLQERLSVVKAELCAVEKSENTVLASIRRLDAVKSDLERAKKALHEADNWSVLAADAEEAFTTGDLEVVAGILLKMNRSLEALASCDNFEDRKLHLEELKNRLEAVASPRVVEAFTACDTAGALKMVEIFDKIDRTPRLVDYFANCEKARLCGVWEGIGRSDADALEAFKSLYDELLLNWQKKIKWCSLIFKQQNMTRIMSNLYASVLSSLNSDLKACVDLSLKHRTKHLFYLLDLHSTSGDFLRNLQSLRLFNNNESSDEPDWSSVIEAVYSPYIAYASKYGSLERALLDELWWEKVPKEEDRQDLMDEVRHLGLTIPTALDLAREAENRCWKLTGHCAAPGLISSLKGFFLKYLDDFKKVALKLRQTNDKSENWTLFNICLTYQQILGELWHEIKGFDEQLLNAVKTKKPNHLLMLNEEAANDYRKLRESILNGSLNLALVAVTKAVEKIILHVHDTAYRVTFKPIEAHLNQAVACYELKSSQAFNNALKNMPEYSFTPLEHVTQIGEYLITLPQHLEPFLSKDDSPLICALKSGPILEEMDGVSSDRRYAHALLAFVTKGLCDALVTKVLTLNVCDVDVSKQIVTDINYLGNVLEELGAKLSDKTRHLCLLMKCTPNCYDEESKKNNLDPKLTAAIRKIRNIP